LLSGVAKIRLVDFDNVTLSSLNRHAAAGLADVGTPKVKCLENALRRFSRWIEIDPRRELWKKENGGALLEGVDWVIGGGSTKPLHRLRVHSFLPTDAIDNISTKVDLLHHCHSHNIKVGRPDALLEVPEY
jgi:tRNA threonylcarbamoyladenosine dehydratase